MKFVFTFFISGSFFSLFLLPLSFILQQISSCTLLIFHRCPTNPVKYVVICSFSSRFSPVRRLGEWMVKYSPSDMDITASQTGPLHRGNSTFPQQSWFLETVWSYANDQCMSAPLWWFHSDREIHGVSAETSLSMFIKTSWIFLSNAF